ncbi:MAG: hypothetical protein EOO55_02025 [Hymenobacter sp.]|nr:MAG: hypothetical protein EOO55_02025 [Hymenobacter sp.]
MWLTRLARLSLASWDTLRLRARRYTAEGYVALEEKSDVRHEFFEGEIFAMAGANIVHNILAGNLYIALRQSVRGKKCRV